MRTLTKLVTVLITIVFCYSCSKEDVCPINNSRNSENKFEGNIVKSQIINTTFTLDSQA